jgi:redox-sensitive bicupin YhaK (pirin superfamily)
MTKPRYQGFTATEIPSVDVQKGLRARVYAGTLSGKTGPCLSHSPMNVYELNLNGPEAGQTQIPLAVDTNTLILVLRGNVTIAGEQCATGQVAVLSREGAAVSLSSKETVRMLLLNGAPLNDPIVAHGPFVMNTTEEINQAIADYQSGKMGRLK